MVEGLVTIGGGGGGGEERVNITCSLDKRKVMPKVFVIKKVVFFEKLHLGIWELQLSNSQNA